jgi:hypothetical protein
MVPKIFAAGVDPGGVPFDVSVRARWTGPFPPTEGDMAMTRYMMIMRTTPEGQAAAKDIDFNEIIAAMGRYNESMLKAGVLLAGEGLAPEAGFVVDFQSDPPVVTDGPYAEAKELFNGFWMIAASSLEEAKLWARKAPLGPGTTLEVRRVQEVEDFPPDNEWVAKEIQWRADAAKNAAK